MTYDCGNFEYVVNQNCYVCFFFVSYGMRWKIGLVVQLI